MGYGCEKTLFASLFLQLLSAVLHVGSQTHHTGKEDNGKDNSQGVVQLPFQDVVQLPFMFRLAKPCHMRAGLHEFTNFKSGPNFGGRSIDFPMLQCPGQNHAKNYSLIFAFQFNYAAIRLALSETP